MSLDTFFRVAHSSGGILYLMALLLLVALTIVLERSWFLGRVLAAGHRLIGRLDSVAAVEAPLLRDLGSSCGRLPHARLLDAVAKHDLAHEFDRLPEKIEEAIMREAPHIDRSLWVLDTIVTLAPLLGLLGTIIGMFNAFQVLSDPGNAPTQVTGGVAEALLATASGLLIAILGLVFFNGLNNRVRVIMHQLETLKVMLVNRMYPHYHAPAQAGPQGRLHEAGPRALRAG
ncbi:MAG TPA: MotA/TolQ/ExbB proton channel family protein [Burkholderiales bacterium]|nr:MotA/TolQ/ExbB proton channel family protein [Burkholderiales bacterium]